MTFCHKGRLFVFISLFQIAAFGALFVRCFSLAHAQEEEAGVTVHQVSQEDRDGDGWPDVAVIACSFATPLDEVLVFDRADNMIVSPRWEEATDFSDDFWVFDAGADGEVELIIGFSEKDGRVIAEVYDDQDGDGQVAYHLQAGRPIVDSPHWTLRVSGEQGWRLTDGTLNLALEILADGRVPVVFPGEFPAYQAEVHNDGIVDGDIQVVDQDGDGIPDFELQRLLHEIPSTWSLKRTVLRVNMHELPSPDYVDSIFWPYLGNVEHHFEQRSYVRHPPPIQVDWSRARIVFLESVIPGYPFENGWYLNSFQRIDDGVVNEVSFENPMAYYDLANDHDAAPELHVRNAYFLPHDRYFLSGYFAKPIENIRYSWDQDNGDALRWDYALHLAARNPITSTVSFGDFSVRAIPYAQVPYWATEQAADSAVFVAVEGESSRSSEGIYERGGVRTLREMYLTGISDTPPWSPETAISVFEGGERIDAGDPPRGDMSGLRVEYNLTLQDQPYLYFCPVDHRLHLLRAEYGVWKVDDHAEVHYANLHGDGYLDQWQYLEDGELRYQLNVTSGYLVLSGGDFVLLKQVQVPPALFQTLPPRNHAEWLALGEQLEEHQSQFGPADLEAMVAQFEGAEWSILRGQLRDFRPTEEGFRFVLNLEAGFRSTGQLAPQDVSSTGHGVYLVQAGSDLSIRPLTPPALSVLGNQLVFETEEIEVLERVRTTAVIENQGLQDVNHLRVSFFEEKDGVRRTFAEWDTAIKGDGEQTVSTLWVPAQSGDWQVGVQVNAGDEGLPPGGSTYATAVVQVEVVPPTLRQADLLALWGEHPAGGVLSLVILAAIAVIAASSFLLLVRTEGAR